MSNPKKYQFKNKNTEKSQKLKTPLSMCLSQIIKIVLVMLIIMHPHPFPIASPPPRHHLKKKKIVFAHHLKKKKKKKKKICDLPQSPLP